MNHSELLSVDRRRHEQASVHDIVIQHAPDADTLFTAAACRLRQAGARNGAVRLWVNRALRRVHGNSLLRRPLMWRCNMCRCCAAKWSGPISCPEAPRPMLKVSAAVGDS